jgi:hypothetical protein
MPIKSKEAIKRKRLKEKSQREHRGALNLCTRCGKNRPPVGRKQCGKCRGRNQIDLIQHRSKPHVPRDVFMDRARSREIFDEALRGETFGEDPGYVNITLRFTCYNAIAQREQPLPGKTIKLLFSSIEEVDEALRVINRALTDWIAGVAHRLY